GIITSHINTTCDYIIKGTDIDDDNIQYIINWDDKTNQTISPLLKNNTAFNTTHSWSTGGIYDIIVYTIDENNATSDKQNYTVLIDAYYCGTIGYLVDKNGDGTYDVFYNKTTEKETNIQKNNSEYNIDINDDKQWDHTFNITTNKINTYNTSTTQESNTINIEPKWIIPIIALVITTIILILILIFINKRKNEKQKEKKTLSEIKKEYLSGQTNKIYAFTTKDEKTKKMHDDIDKLLLEKKIK
ncbi:MAG: hypothetical protein MUO82_10950, partial [Candidatus Thermoplasmatota archaeon]|nr:hypothetical protein [Candidatus Thermoplasmatota archaeon]